MKLRLVTALGLSMLVSQVWATSHDANAQNVLKTENDKISYTIGVDIGENLKAQSLDINPELLSRGVQDAVAGKKYLMTKEEMQQNLLSLQQKLVEEQKNKMKAMAEKNAADGKAFLEANKSKEGVQTLPSGLQYKVVEAGNGNSPSADDVVTVDYEGKTVNGTVFDSSYQRGKPVQFKVSQVIPGWQEALQKMKAGATWELFIPPELAYGERGLGGPIGPNETLIFKVHLISIDDAAKQQEAAAKKSTKKS